MNKREVGSKYEDMAAEYIKSEDMQVIERNFSSRFGEIDIIATNSGLKMIVFYEVKFRKMNIWISL